MRILSTLLALLLATQPVMAQAQKAGKFVDAGHGCQLWDSDPKPNETYTWAGACRDGLAQGRGVAEMFKDNHPYWRYEGEIRDRKVTGHGVYTWPNGNRYEGEFRDDLRSGRGVFTWPNGDRYEGEFRDGKQNGRGVITWPNGDRYEGEFRDGKPNGLGQYTTSNDSFNGIWTHGCYSDGNRRTALGVKLSSCP